MDDQTIGLILAISSSLFIGSSFIIKKKGLKKAGARGVSAGSGGHSYLTEPMWWAGMFTMIFGEVANFAAYAFAPAVLVTPLGALSIIVSAILAHRMLNEKLSVFGWLGCCLCIVGSTVIVLHAPEERPITSVHEVWELAKQPGFMLYASGVVFFSLALAVYVAPIHGNTQILVFVGICSLVGSLSVMSVKTLGIALKLTFDGDNQLLYPETGYCVLVVVASVITQMNYLNKALDVFNTAIVSPIYYVLFTCATIVASGILFKDFQNQKWAEVLSEVCGFITILAGVFLLHATKDDCSSSSNFPKRTPRGMELP
ncbi:hypothetical protein CYMTET_38202 [Cymbomonas tetramitiformis]|uniref:Probable magnesium transporter n=1 Tax=Cymbomonas tetramitiformis TaxID=36881 RepID=A0AAE0CE76_9CHLO|nr:hypothetical protein CYMTET_38202 [Cymbomonas tetramitiformis]